MSTPVLVAVTFCCGMLGGLIGALMISMGTPEPVGAAFAIVFAGATTAYLTENA